MPAEPIRFTGEPIRPEFDTPPALEKKAGLSGPVRLARQHLSHRRTPQRMAQLRPAGPHGPQHAPPARRRSRPPGLLGRRPGLLPRPHPHRPHLFGGRPVEIPFFRTEARFTVDFNALESALAPAQRQCIAEAVNINNSDIDFCEHRGRVVINYSWGNQKGVEHLAEAVYHGTLEQFLKGWYG